MTISTQGRPSPIQWFAILCVIGLSIGGIFHISSVALEWASDYEPGAVQLSDRLVEKKSMRLQRVIDGMIAGDYERVAEEAHKIEKLAESMDWFIADKEYEPDRTAFRESLAALQAAAESNNSEAAIRSADAVVDSCMRCHEHMLQDRIQP